MKRCMGAIVVVLLASSLIRPLPALAYDARLSAFQDVKESDWAATPIYRLSAMGMIDGYDDGTFRPQDSISREAFVSMLVSAARIPAASKDVPMSDVSGQRWSYGVLQAAGQAGLLDDLLADGKIRPSEPITREEAADLMGRYAMRDASPSAKQLWLADGWKTEAHRDAFADLGKFTKEYMPFVFYAVKDKLFSGDKTGTFRPHDPISRREAAAVIDRLLEEAAQRQDLEVDGFYAINSYKAIDQMSKLNTVITGWSQLRYGGPGQADVDLNASSSFRMPEGAQEVLQKADTAGVAKQLMVYADGDRLQQFLQDKAAVQAFVADASKLLQNKDYGYDGLCVDFEGLKAETDAPMFADFLKELRGHTPGKTLSVAVPPPFFYHGYDYAAIGKQADSVILMAHDFTNIDARAPSAPLPLVRASIAEVLKDVPKEKLVLGISKQATQWTDSGDGTVVSYPDSQLVEARIAHGVSVDRLELPQFLRHLLFKDDRGSHEIWYEDAASISEKIRLARIYGLRGISLWYMGNLTDADWKLVGTVKQTNGQP